MGTIARAVVIMQQPSAVMKSLPILFALAVIAVPFACRADDSTDRGAQVYMQSRCFACHGQLGTGGFGPTLAGDRILALQDFVIAQILIGRGKMPAFGDRLSDDDVAAVAQYIRNNWGNHFGPVTSDNVASIRELMKKTSGDGATTSSSQH